MSLLFLKFYKLSGPEGLCIESGSDGAVTQNSWECITRLCKFCDQIVAVKWRWVSIWVDRLDHSLLLKFSFDQGKNQRASQPPKSRSVAFYRHTPRPIFLDAGAKSVINLLSNMSNSRLHVVLLRVEGMAWVIELTSRLAIVFFLTTHPENQRRSTEPRFLYCIVAQANNSSRI